jgi:NAD(P)-dependent dehydrogenase (short-subunit alcohol dehydrogenase family)
MDGRLDILVNAAGIDFGRLLVRSDPVEAQNVMDTNLMSAINACNFAGSHLKKTCGE